MTCITLGPVFDLAKLCDASMPRFHTYPKLHISLLDGRMKRKAISKAFGEDHTHFERSSVSFEELNFVLQNFQNLRKES